MSFYNGSTGDKRPVVNNKNKFANLFDGGTVEDDSTKGHNFLTIMKARVAVNKKINRNANGETVKGKATHPSTWKARMVRVDTPQDMVDLQEFVSSDACLCIMRGYFPDVGLNETFTILSAKEMASKIDCVEGSKEIEGWHDFEEGRAICRLKANTVQSSWQLFDRDITADMPKEIAALDDDGWFGALAEIFPGLKDVGYVRVPSTSSRVLVDGVPLEAAGCHYWWQCTDPTDAERFGKVLLLKSMDTDYGYYKNAFSKSNPNEIVSQRAWSIFDPTVFNGGRVVYAGKPSVKGKGLTVAPPNISIYREGGKVDTSLLATPTTTGQTGFIIKTSSSMSLVKNKDGTSTKQSTIKLMAHDSTSLKLDTIIDLGGGKTTTVTEFWKSDLDKVRCQVPFRNSTSMNGYLSKHKDGTPFVYDNGWNTKYLLDDETLDNEIITNFDYGQKGAENTTVNELGDICRKVQSKDDYDKVVGLISAVSEAKLVSTDRALLVGIIADTWSHNAKIPIAFVREDLKYKRDKSAVLPEWSEDWLFIENSNTFYNAKVHTELKPMAFDFTYMNQSECKTEKASASRLVCSYDGFTKVYASMYYPGESMFFEYQRQSMVNSYRPNLVQPCSKLDDDGQDVIDLFLNHTKILFPDETDRNILLDWLAYVLQNPGKRINWALVIQGGKSVGKSFFGDIYGDILGSNAKQISPKLLAKDFSTWSEGSVLSVIEEIRIAGKDKYATLEHLKPYITNSTISVEGKGEKERSVINFTNYLMFTNHKDAIPMDETERRYCVLFTAQQDKNDNIEAFGKDDNVYFTKLYDESRRRPDALAYYLMNRKISSTFEPKGNAPTTSAKVIMAALTASPEKEAVQDAILASSSPVINMDVLNLTELNIENRHCYFSDNYPNSRVMTQVLLELGFSPCVTKARYGRKGKSHTVWHGPNITQKEALDRVNAYLRENDNVDGLVKNGLGF